jgi:hypothetical protein
MAKLPNSPGWEIPTMLSCAIFPPESGIYLPASVDDFLESRESSSKKQKLIFRVFDEMKGVSDETISFSRSFSPAE